MPFTLPQPPARLKFEDSRGRPILRTCADAREMAAAIFEGHRRNWNLLGAEPEWLALEIYQEAGLWRVTHESQDLREVTIMAGWSKMPWRIVDLQGNVLRRGDGEAEVVEV